MSLNLIMMFLVLRSASATVSVVFSESNGTFETSKNINFFYKAQIGRGTNGTIHHVEIGLNPDEYVLKQAKTGKEQELRNEWEVAKRVKNLKRGQARIIKIIAIGMAFGDVEGEVVLMEYEKSHDLFEIEFEQYSTSLETILDIGLLLVDCFELLSEAGVYHMDVKPDNILYNPETKELVLIDLGGAYFEGCETWKSNILGTIPYTCPCIGDHIPDHKCDIRSMMFMLAMPRYDGKLPWMEQCRELDNNYTLDLFNQIRDAKYNFEDAFGKLEELGKELNGIFLKVHDQVIKNQTGAIDFSAIRLIFDAGSVKPKKDKPTRDSDVHTVIEEGLEEPNKNETTSNLDSGKKNGRKEKVDKEKKKVESNLIIDTDNEETKGNGNKKFSFSSLVGIKSKTQSFIKKFTRKNLRKSKVVTNPPNYVE